MLTRVSPQENYDPDNESRHTGLWMTRNLGSPHWVSYNPRGVERRWEPLNPDHISLYFLISALELGCAVAFTGLGIYHLVTGTGYGASDSVGIITSGAASVLVGLVSMIAFLPEKTGRITKRLVVVFSLPSTYTLLQSTKIIAFKTAINGTNIYHFVETGLASIILLLILTIVYPASRACIPNEGSRRGAVTRASVLTGMSVTGLSFLLYLCFSMYGLRNALTTGNADADTITLSILVIIISSLMLLATVGALYAVVEGAVAYMVPYLVMGVVAFTSFLMETSASIEQLNYGNIYLAMLILHCIALTGLACGMSMVVSFLFV